MCHTHLEWARQPPWQGVYTGLTCSGKALPGCAALVTRACLEAAGLRAAAAAAAAAVIPARAAAGLQAAHGRAVCG